MNLLQRLRQTLIPPPRRKVTWQTALPLILFAVLFAVICGILLGLSKLDFVRPWMLGLLAVAPWVWWMQAAGHSGLSGFRGGLSVFVRLCILGLLVMVLAEPRSVRVSDTVSVIFNVDVSDSVGAHKNWAMDFVDSTAKQKPAADEAGLVVFGRNAAVELPPRQSFPFEKVVNSRVGQDATNLEQSLAISAAMLPEENQGRVVLISDGTETVGRLKDIVGDLQSRDVAVDVVPIDYSYEKEVLLERLDLPRHVRLGETHEASVVLNSLAEGSGDLVLLQNGEELGRQSVDFRQGKNRYRIPVQVNTPGYYEYTARIEVPATEDQRVENNEVTNYIYIEGPGRILLVTDPQDEPQEWQYFEKALQNGEREVEVVSALSFPPDPLSLMPYDCIVFADVPADTLTSVQVQSVHDAVRDLGLGFIMLGGPDSFGPGGYQNSPIEDCLPISMEISNKKILPKAALVIILHTCEFPQGNSWAKRITKEAVRVLNSEDEVGAIGYGSSGDYWIFELTPAGEYDSLVTKINAAQIGDMPAFESSMALGLKGLLESDASSRHMIIISDGDPPMPTPQVMQKFRDEQVTVSTVAVFPHGPRDADVLSRIASLTRGRFYYPNDPTELPSIFIKEAKTLRRSQLQKRTFTPTVTGVDPILQGIDGFPPLHGYVLTSEKEDPRASLLLAAPPKEGDIVADESDLDPILAFWRYGLGASAAFTSDMTNDWGRDWVSWDRFQQLVTQMVTRVSRAKKQQYLRVYTYTSGNEGVVVVEDFHPDESLLDLEMTVTGPDNFRRVMPVRQTATRRYQTSLALQGQGRYQVQVRVTGGRGESAATADPVADARGEPVAETAYGGFIVSYSPEYLRFRANPIVLEELRQNTGGNEIDIDADPEQLAGQIYGQRNPKRSTTAVFDWFLMTLACLIPMDVAVRRVQIDFRSLFGFLKKPEKKETSATMGALLDRARSVRSEMDTRKESTSRSAGASVVRRPTAPAKPATPAKSEPQKSATETNRAQEKPDDGSTTSRLLALKRKREQDGGD